MPASSDAVEGDQSQEATVNKPKSRSGRKPLPPEQRVRFKSQRISLREEYWPRLESLAHKLDIRSRANKRQPSWRAMIRYIAENTELIYKAMLIIRQLGPELKHGELIHQAILIIRQLGDRDLLGMKIATTDEEKKLHSPYTVSLLNTPSLAIAEVFHRFMVEHHRPPMYILLGHEEWFGITHDQATIRLDSDSYTHFRGVPLLKVDRKSFLEVV